MQMKIKFAHDGPVCVPHAPSRHRGIERGMGHDINGNTPAGSPRPLGCGALMPRFMVPGFLMKRKWILILWILAGVVPFVINPYQ